MRQEILRVEATRNRRRFLKFLFSSPLLLGVSHQNNWAQQADAPGQADLRHAINVFDLEAVAQAKIAPHHWAYLASGGDDEKTLRANADDFDLYQIRPKRFVDIRQMDLSCELFGQRYPSPLFLSPVGSQKAFHPEAEVATAKAAAQRGHQMVLSSVSSFSVSEVAASYGRAPWFQLYPTDVWSVTEGIIRRAEDAGCPALVLTLDNGASSNRERLIRERLNSKVPCNACHTPGPQGYLSTRGTYRGLDLSSITTHLGVYTWELIDRIRNLTKMKMVAKGIMTAGDAALSVERGFDAVWVSNHGGRQLNSLFAPIEALPEVVQAVNGRCPILLDGGVRRGTDIFKALALGASAVCIGRPYIWGLGGFGQAGVAKALELLDAELLTDMKLAGTPTIAAITSSFVQRRQR
ncbi:MAG: alpha-hydroxy-acid oxidizing protein [Bryobacterales bacterium]|nr:alpha-hydroxy-acid oxidizing protein [Bryobacterales bacterium]